MTVTRIVRRGSLRSRLMLGVAAPLLVGTAIVGAGPRALTASAATASTTNSVGFAVSQATDATSGNIYEAAQGPNHSLYFYWDLKGTWYGPIAVAGNGTTYSAPSMTIDSSHNVVIAAEGPGNRLFFYWNVSGKWYGPLQVGATGAATSTPSLALDLAGHLDLAVQSPGQSLSFFWNVNATWYGPYGLGGPGTTMSGPSLSSFSQTVGTVTTHYLFAAVQGPQNSLLVYANTGGPWTVSQSNFQTTYAAPFAASNDFYVQGAGNDLDNWYWDTSGQRVAGNFPIGPGGSTLSAPSATGVNEAAAVGPSKSLYFYWLNAGWHGPLGLGGAGSAWSVPSLSSANPANGNNPTVAVEGPNNTLLFYWNLSGTWYGPLGIGAAGTTFSSPN